MAYPATRYIERGDLDGAYDRYLTTNKNWKEHWFETCYTIYKQSKKWAKKYFIDPITKTINRLFEAVTLPNSALRISNSTAYIIKAYDNRLKREVIKIGKADDIRRRYSGDKNYKVLKIYKEYGFISSDRALAMEDVIRSVFKRYFKNQYVAKDRFLISKRDIPNEVWRILDRKVDEIDELFALA